jgi:opacity protein-like surface antigen
MKKLIANMAWLFLIPMLASAQKADHPPRWQGYGFVGAGTHGMTPTAGFGGEVYVTKGLGIGAEVGAAALTTQRVTAKTTGVGSADLSYHFFPKKIRGNGAPFVAGGYTVFFGHNTHTGTGLWGHKPLMTQGFNVGGGVDLFASKHVGVRFDVRYHGHGGNILNYTYPNLDQFSFVAFRIGVTFR